MERVKVSETVRAEFPRPHGRFVGEGHPFRRRPADQFEDRSAGVVRAAGHLELNDLRHDPFELSGRHGTQKMLDSFGLESDTRLGLIVQRAGAQVSK
jgi:hypothetical protein